MIFNGYDDLIILRSEGAGGRSCGIVGMRRTGGNRGKI